MREKIYSFFNNIMGPLSSKDLQAYKKPWLWMMGWGSLSALGFAPLFYSPLTLLSFIVFLRFLRVSSSPKQAFWWGWFFSFGYFVAGLYWIAHCFAVDWDRFWFLYPLTLLGLPGFLSFYGACVGWLTRYFIKEGSPLVPSFVLFACFWVLSEYGRTYLFSGFPWNLLGYIWGKSLVISQVASLGGVYGLSLITLLLSGSLDLLWRRKIRENKRELISFGLLLLGLIIYGQYRLLNQPWQDPLPPSVRGRLVQPNIPQKDKWTLDKRWENFQQHIALSLLPSDKPLDMVIWPESVLFAKLLKEPSYRKAIRRIIPRQGIFILGAVRLYKMEEIHLANSILVLDHLGRLLGKYDKSHLVPFGEFIPFSRFLPLRKLTEGARDFTPGLGPTTMDLTPRGISVPPFTPLVCYEVIFPQGVRQSPDEPQAQWILNVTNDGWYGHTSGPYQHLVAAQFRSIEQGMPLIRVANTGISAVFDGYGRRLHKLSLNREGIIDFDLPAALSIRPLYYHWGDFPWLIVVFLLLGFSFRTLKTSHRSTSSKRPQRKSSSKI